MVTFTFFTALLFAAVHLFAGKLRFLDQLPRSRWLSAAGGVSVAYVFLHLLPELSERQHALGEDLLFVERHVYTLALVGLAVFYGLERVVASSREEAYKPDNAEEEVSQGATNQGAFWLSTLSFALYNLIIGYLLLSAEADNLTGFVYYATALALHFVVNDYGLRHDHQQRYHRVGRFVLAAAVLVGWGLGRLISIPDLWVTDLLAFLSGGVILNVLKEELPEERESSFWAFSLGALGYAGLLLLS